MAKKKIEAQEPKEIQKIRPALTPEAEEDQMIALATNLVKQRFLDGTASSQETTHYLKLGSQKARVELEILREQKELIKARTEAIKSVERMEELYREAMAAMSEYRGTLDGNGTDIL